jgi:hypothetical protein
MNYLKVGLGILIALSVTRFIPHPPNFTSLIALSFYVPIIFGLKFIPALIICYVLTDFFIGFHSVSLFTWGSVALIGLMSVHFNKGILNRFFGVFSGCLVFFIISNFGVWSLGSYGYNFSGLLSCYVLAIPFFGYTLISSLIFSTIIETFCKLFKVKSLVFTSRSS